MDSSAKKYFNLGITAHQKGNLKEAEEFYRQALQSDPKHADANHNLGVLGLSTGQHDAAIPFFMTAIGANPEEAQYWVSCLTALLNVKKIEQAAKLIEVAKTTNLSPAFIESLTYQLNQADDRMPNSEGYLIKLRSFYEGGKFSQAVELSKELSGVLRFETSILNITAACHLALSDFNSAALDFKLALVQQPESVQLYNNLGVVEHEVGGWNKADTYYVKALMIQPDFSNVYYNLGRNNESMKDRARAIIAYKSSILLTPAYSQAYYNLAISSEKLGLTWEAILLYSKAAKLDPLSTDIYNNLGLALTSYTPEAPSGKLTSIVLDLLEKKIFVRPNAVASAVWSWVHQHTNMANAIRLLYDNGSEFKLAEICSNLSKIKILSVLMTLCPVTDVVIEEMLVHIRKKLLFNRKYIEDTQAILPFQSSLAIQTFVNEFVYYETEEEGQEIKRLEQEIENSILKNGEYSEKAIACLASYRLLHDYKWVTKITPTPALDNLFNAHVHNIQKEKTLRQTIKTLNPISEGVSLAVREQYEENPYPRWINTRLVGTYKTVNEFAGELKLNLDGIDNLSPQPNILVAGCGTGQHALYTASLFKDSKVLAIDLSLSSLSYAKRKTEELGFTNIDYLHADILDLRMLGMQFDIVESLGVLHHMSDPYLGWETLVDCLKPGGLMTIGLYSDVALRKVVEITDIIKKRRIPTDKKAMLNFRKEIMLSTELLKKTAPFYDFYSTSEYRDLWFHVQQHRFTLPLIKKHLSDLGLKFSGFALRGTKTQNQFTQKYSDEKMLFDLDKWNEFELEFPDTFMEMYQFWCQKIV